MDTNYLLMFTFISTDWFCSQPSPEGRLFAMVVVSADSQLIEVLRVTGWHAWSTSYLYPPPRLENTPGEEQEESKHRRSRRSDV